MRLIIFFMAFGFSAFSQKNWIDLAQVSKSAKWKTAGDIAPFLFKEHSIEMHQKANTKEHSFLITKKKYTNFILEFEGKRDSSFHYGLLFRADKAPDTAHVRLYGYQVKIDHIKTRGWTGAIFDDFGNTWQWISTNENNPQAQKALKPAGEWDKFRIEAIDAHIVVWLNGIITADILNSKYQKGHIALKIHALGNKKELEAAKAEFRNIRIIDRNFKKYSKIALNQIPKP
jgi:hypothetical protein